MMLRAGRRACLLRWPAAVVVALLLHGTDAAAQRPQLTVENVFASNEFRTRGAHVEFPGTGTHILVQEPAEGGLDIFLEDVRTGARERLVEGRRLVPPGSITPLVIEEVQLSAERGRALIRTNSERVRRGIRHAEYYVYDIEPGQLRPLSRRSGGQLFARFAPDGRRVAFVRDDDLFVSDVRNGGELALTTDGGDGILNGIADRVYQEAFGLSDAWQWSPDGSSIAYLHFDQSDVGTFHLLDDLDLYTAAVPIRYAKAGTANASVELRVVHIATGETKTVFTVDGDSYLPRIAWAGPAQLAVQRLNRHQNRLELLLVDIASDTVTPILIETDSAWVDVDDHLTWYDGGRRFLWSSERDGRNHLYAYRRDGTLVGQVTRGDFDVTALHGVSGDGWVYYSAAAPTARERNFFRVRVDGTRTERLTPEPGTHDVRLSADHIAFIDHWSRAGEPPAIRLFTTDGRVRRTLADNAALAQKLDRMGLNRPEFFEFTTRDGATLTGWMLKPPDFDPAREYAALLYTYGGPGSQIVTDEWGGSRYLWHQLLAERGVVVVSIDNRGTAARGRDFRRSVYLRLGQLETRDQIDLAHHLAAQHWVDPERIGIWGWSYGGYVTALAMMSSDVFTAGVAVAPVADWRLYDTGYTERFMRTPGENPEGYADGSPIERAASLSGRLLLIHGTDDDNVHFQNTVQLAHALQDARRQFDLMIYPDRTHSITGGTTTVHLYTFMTDWLMRTLVHPHDDAS